MDKSEELIPLFASLDGYMRRNDCASILSVADRILTIIPGDKQMLQVKCVSYIKQGKFNEALNVALKSEDLKFEQAFCLFKQRKYDAALKAMEGCESVPAISVLRAQVLYRLDRFSESADLYMELHEAGAKGVDMNELQCNLLAALTMSGRSTEAVKIIEKGAAFGAELDRNVYRQSFEMAFNGAAAYLKTNDFVKAEKSLAVARALCRESCEEDEMSEEEILSEVAGVAVMQSIVEQVKGSKDGVRESYETALNQNPADSSVVAVALNNLACLKAAQSPYDALNSVIKAASVAKNLTLVQKTALLCNKAILRLRVGKMSKFTVAVSEIERESPESEIPVALKASAVFKGSKMWTYEQLATELEKIPSSVSALLLKAQIHMLDENLESALEVFSTLPVETRSLPSAVCCEIAILKALGRQEDAIGCIEVAVEYWNTSSDKLAAPALAILVAHKADVLVTLGHSDDAEDVMAELSAEASTNKAKLAAISGLCHSLGELCLDHSDVLGEMLEDFKFGGSANVAPLSEAMPWHIADKETEEAEITHHSSATRRAHKKAVRLQKYLAALKEKASFKEHYTPDKNQWLKKKKRVRRKDGRRIGVTGGAQGAGDITDKDAHRYDARVRASEAPSKPKAKVTRGGKKQRKKGGRRR